jgi:thiamine biosynthesis protein ThiI
MSVLYLLKPGELVLKGGNRDGFEHILLRNLGVLLRSSGAGIKKGRGRIYVRCPKGGEEKVEDALDHLLGISGWARTRECDKTVEAALRACVEEARGLFEEGTRTFKIEARRTDKSFPLDSYGIRCGAGDAVTAAFPEMKVDVRNPRAVIYVEIRERAYVYSRPREGKNGLPVGSAGRGLLLLSGGIDSPVAGYMMAGRGMGVDAVYFHAWPYTSDRAKEKVLRLAEILGRYTLGTGLYIIGFTAVQKRIKERAPEAWLTVLLRMAMMESAERIALARGSKCLITGESLSQVASQTIENIACTESRIRLPVLRPLIGMDKHSIIRMAESLGTYRVSILPYQDCCVLFSPPHPVLRGKSGEANALYESLDLGDLIGEALNTAEIVKQ